MVNNDLYQIIVGIAFAAVGWVIRVLWDSVKELQQENKELVIKLNEVETLVAGDYVKRSYFESKIDALFIRLDSIRDRLDQKADK